MLTDLHCPDVRERENRVTAILHSSKAVLYTDQCCGLLGCGITPSSHVMSSYRRIPLYRYSHVTLSHRQIVIQLNHYFITTSQLYTVTSSHRHVIPSYRHTVIPSHRRTVTPSHRHTATTSHRHAVTRPHPHTATPCHCHIKKNVILCHYALQSSLSWNI